MMPQFLMGMDHFLVASLVAAAWLFFVKYQILNPAHTEKCSHSKEQHRSKKLKFRNLCVRANLSFQNGKITAM